MKTYSTNISYLFNRQQWSFGVQRVPSVKLQYSKRVLRQTKGKLNRLQITIHLYTTYILNRIISTTFISACGILNYAFKSKMKKVEATTNWSISDVLLSFFFTVECFFFFLLFFLEIYHLLGKFNCATKHRDPNVMGYVGTWKPSLSETFRKQIVLQYDSHRKCGPKYKLGQKNVTSSSLEGCRIRCFVWTVQHTKGFSICIVFNIKCRIIWDFVSRPSNQWILLKLFSPQNIFGLDHLGHHLQWPSIRCEAKSGTMKAYTVYSCMYSLLTPLLNCWVSELRLNCFDHLKPQIWLSRLIFASVMEKKTERRGVKSDSHSRDAYNTVSYQVGCQLLICKVGKHKAPCRKRYIKRCPVEKVYEPI